MSTSTHEDDEVIREFLLESTENLNQLDRDFVDLEAQPDDRSKLGAIFRCIHTIKGTSGFLGFPKLETLTHSGENILARLRDGELVLDAATTSALLAMVDAVRRSLAAIETTGQESDEDHSAILERLSASARGNMGTPSAKPSAAVATPSTSDGGFELFAAPAPMPAPSPSPASTPVAAANPSPMHAAAPPAAPDASASAPKAETPKAETPKAETPKAETTKEVTVLKPPAVSDTTIRVDVGLLDRVMNLVGELVLARNQIIQFGSTAKDVGFVKASQRLNLLTTELQEAVMKTRMQPIGNVWQKFPRIVRDLAQACGKKVTLELDGQETELDRTILEAIKDPLTHAVRNAVDHGIETPSKRLERGKGETGRLLLRAFHEGGQVNIEISDDGGGLDLARIRARAVERNLVTSEQAAKMSDREASFLIFHPGFSTAEKVTNVSGRGVGMDVVKTNVEKIGGTVDLQTRFGAGTTIKIKIPLTLAIIPALIVNSGGDRYAIPQVNLLELVRLEGENIRKSVEQLHGTTVYRLRGNLLPLVFLNKVLDLDSRQVIGDELNIVVLQADDRQFGIVVDGICDTEEIVVKPLGKELKSASTFAGATIMGDGRVALILDVFGIVERSGLASARERSLDPSTTTTTTDAEKKETLLVFNVGRDGRMAIPLSMVARLEEIPATDVESAGGREVVQYRGAILPLIRLGENEYGRSYDDTAPTGPLQVIVYSEHRRSVGFVVERIVDVVEEAISVRHHARAEGVLGAAVIQGKVTDLLDVHGVIRRRDPSFFEEIH